MHLGSAGAWVGVVVEQERVAKIVVERQQAALETTLPELESPLGISPKTPLKERHRNHTAR